MVVEGLPLEAEPFPEKKAFQDVYPGGRCGLCFTIVVVAAGGRMGCRKGHGSKLGAPGIDWMRGGKSLELKGKTDSGNI